MKKIPTIFVRDFTKRGAITDEWHSDALWVRDGEGVGSRKFDGAACRWDGERLWKRREVKGDCVLPTDFESCGVDTETNKHVGWVPVDESNDDQWFREALVVYVKDGGALIPGTYEAVGPKINGNRDKFPKHTLIWHGSFLLKDVGRGSDGHRCKEAIRAFLAEHEMEGIVWHNRDGRMAKIKRKDFGLPW